MDIDRRNFLKIVGLSTAISFGTDVISKTSVNAFNEVSNKQLTAKRWAIVINTKKLTPEIIKNITEACHKSHNVPNITINKDQEVKWIWGSDFEHAFADDDPYIKTETKNSIFPLLCNHCDNPPCVRVCPTEATFRRNDGIVMMDMHRCIGCRFCMAACPFGARSFNFMDPRPFVENENKEFPTRMRGVVEKCTFCYERLSIGLAPICEEAGSGSIITGDIEDINSSVRKILSENTYIKRKPHLGTNPQVFYIV